MTEVNTEGVIPKVLGYLPMTDLMQDPYGTLANLREASPAVAVNSAGFRVWVITRHEEARRALADPTVIRNFAKYGREVVERCLVGKDRIAYLPGRTRRSFRERDGEDHHRMRALIGHVFSPANVAKLAKRVEKISHELLEPILPERPVELMNEYIRPLCGRTICELAGFPIDELSALATFENDMQTSPVNEVIMHALEMLELWAKKVVEIKRQEPGDDLSTELLRMREESILTEDELTSMYILIMVNGMQSAAAIGNGIFALLTHSDQLASALAEPALFTTGVDEIVRYESPVRIVGTRYTTAPVRLGEVTVPAGELLFIALASGNRDPKYFADPDVFDIARAATGHLGFGNGIHRCLGARLGKMTTGAALEMFFTKFPATELIDPPEAARWRPGKFLRRLDALPVIPKVWD